jgi:hypothetical protein
MTINSLSSPSGSYQIQTLTPQDAFNRSYQAMDTALKSGNLADAQTAFAALQNNFKVGGQLPAADSKVGKDLLTLQKALQSGDTTSAQTALDAVKQDVQSVKVKHHHLR